MDRDEHCQRIYHSRPEWVSGQVSRNDACFLYERAETVNPSFAVEIGTASGVSAAILAHTTRVITYDIREQFYDQPDRRTGDAAREMLNRDLLDRIMFRNPCTALDAAREHQSVPFLFIDANHAHPWPALDLLTMLDSLKPGAEVVLHDINLPVKHPEFPDWGAHWLYHELDTEKRADHRDDPPNIGSITVAGDLRGQLLEIIHGHDWGADVPDAVTSRLLA